MKNLLFLFTLLFVSCFGGERPNKVRAMKVLEYNVEIDAPSDIVYNVMIDKDHFKEWVAVFGPNSFYEGSWEKGRKIIYKSPDENGNIQGMISSIKKNIPNKEIYVQPIGIVENGVEIFSGDKTKDLDKSFENYLFTDNGNGTSELRIRIAVYEELEDYFNDTWPKALKVVKRISETSK